jgi:hypothetical protein
MCVDQGYRTRHRELDPFNVAGIASGFQHVQS